MLWRVIKVGYIAPTAGIEPTSLVFQASVPTILPPRLPGDTSLPHAYLYMRLLA